MNIMLNKSYTGVEIERWCKENKLVSSFAYAIYNKYFADGSRIHPNPKVYYKINKEDGSIYRDLELSPRNCELQTAKLYFYTNNNTSVEGSELIRLSLTEIEDDPSEEFITFYDEVISSPKYRPRSNIYYYLKYNTAGRFFLKRDYNKSPKLKTTA